MYVLGDQSWRYILNQVHTCVGLSHLNAYHFMLLMKKQIIWVFESMKSVHYWLSCISFAPESKELTLYYTGSPPHPCIFGRTIEYCLIPDRHNNLRWKFCTLLTVPCVTTVITLCCGLTYATRLVIIVLSVFLTFMFEFLTGISLFGDCRHVFFMICSRLPPEGQVPFASLSVFSMFQTVLTFAFSFFYIPVGDNFLSRFSMVIL